jgi:alpha-galactosidase
MGAPVRTIEWTTPDLSLSFIVDPNERLWQRGFLPSSMRAQGDKTCDGCGVEVAIQVSGESNPDWGMKQSTGEPGIRLVYVDKREEPFLNGRRFVLVQSDPILNLKVESFYETFDMVPVVRRWTRVTNLGAKSVGLDFLSSAMLHGLSDPQKFDSELRIHLAFNSWMSEGQWHVFRPSELGFVENGRTSRSEASAGSVGSWSTGSYLPIAIVENLRRGVSWFWQIEHNGSWYWEISNVGSANYIADDVYAYLGGPDSLHSGAWKDLAPGNSYQTVPVAIGCVEGGFDAAVTTLTKYRRAVCLHSHADNRKCPVIFNDYMNCLKGDPTEEKELPLIAAAAKAGCEYFIIDAGWYAERGEDWSPTLGAWFPSDSRWPHGLKLVLNRIKEAGMVPGLWIEPEVAGVHSELARKPDSWFMMRHGRRVLNDVRYLLDFRNSEVTGYLNQVIDRLVNDYGVGYLKMDYNADSLLGTDQAADSPGQGLLEHNRAHLAWLDSILQRFPNLTIENCGSGGGRMDYAMLSRLQLQSATDQEEYVNLPAIIVGSLAAVLPEQLACWSYPLEGADVDQASFNMVTAMMCRIHQSGRLDKISSEAQHQVRAGIDCYKTSLRDHICQATSFYPLGMPDVTDRNSPVALGMQSPGQTWIAAWRLDGLPTVTIPVNSTNPRILYPTDLGITVVKEDNMLKIAFPRTRMASVVLL